LLIGVALLVSHAVRHNWLGPAARVIPDMIGGTLLVILGHVTEVRGREKYRVPARCLTGGGAAMFYFCEQKFSAHLPRGGQPPGSGPGRAPELAGAHHFRLPAHRPLVGGAAIHTYPANVRPPPRFFLCDFRGISASGTAAGPADSVFEEPMFFNLRFATGVFTSALLMLLALLAGGPSLIRHPQNTPALHLMTLAALILLVTVELYRITAFLVAGVLLMILSFVYHRATQRLLGERPLS